MNDLNAQQQNKALKLELRGRQFYCRTFESVNSKMQGFDGSQPDLMELVD